MHLSMQRPGLSLYFGKMNFSMIRSFQNLEKMIPTRIRSNITVAILEWMSTTISSYISTYLLPKAPQDIHSSMCLYIQNFHSCFLVSPGVPIQKLDVVVEISGGNNRWEWEASRKNVLSMSTSWLCGDRLVIIVGAQLENLRAESFQVVHF
jgi:hypothetical protein